MRGGRILVVLVAVGRAGDKRRRGGVGRRGFVGGFEVGEDV